MTAKEKAEELVNKFKPHVYPFLGSSFLTGDDSPEVIMMNAKKCAHFVADQVLLENPTLQGTSDDLITMIIQSKAYWNSVKIEIEKLK